MLYDSVTKHRLVLLLDFVENQLEVVQAIHRLIGCFE